MQSDLLFGSPSVAECAIPVLDAGPTSIIDWGGHLWFTLSNKGLLGEYKIPKRSGPAGLPVGEDGALWFTEYTANKIARVAVG